MTAFQLASALGLAAFMWAVGGAAQAPEPAPAAAQPAVAPSAAPVDSATPATAPAPDACYPACREGFTCHEARCVSWCNPPCPEGLACMEGRRCEPPLPGAKGADGKVYEPPPPPTKSFENRNHTLVGFHLGFPAKLTQDERERPLGTTLGFNIRGDSPVAKYVLVGPMLQLGAWSPDVSPEPSRNYYVDLDFVLRFRAPLTTSTYNYQIWLGMPVGVTLDVLGDEVPDKSGVGFGWNIGVLFGGAAHFSSKFGMFGEVGWMQHKVAHDGDTGADLDYRLRQFLLNVGFVIRS